MDTVLFIDTSLGGAGLGLRTARGEWKASHTKRGDADSALCTLLDHGLKVLGKSQADISTVVVSHGPGSFTGIKVGLAWAYGLQAIRQEGLLVGSSSLLQLRVFLDKKHKGTANAVLFPINRREGFLCYAGDKGEERILCIPMDLKNVDPYLTPEGNLWVLGDAPLFHDVQQGCPFKVHHLNPSEYLDLAISALMENTQDLKKSRMVFPQYLKKTTVEEKLESEEQNVSKTS